MQRGPPAAPCGPAQRPGVVIAWRMKTAWPPPFSRLHTGSSVRARAGAGERGEHYKKNSMNKNSATMIVKHP